MKKKQNKKITLANVERHQQQQQQQKSKNVAVKLRGDPTTMWHVVILMFIRTSKDPLARGSSV